MSIETNTTITIVAVIAFVIAVYFSLKFMTAKIIVMFGGNPNTKIANPVKIKRLETSKFNFKITREHCAAAIAVLIICLFIFLGGDNPQKAREQDRARKAFHMIEASKDGVRAQLKDPKSAVFQDVIYVDHLTPAVCGKVNSRNGFGGMSGFQHFMAHGENLIVFEKQMDDFGETWNKLCVR